MSTARAFVATARPTGVLNVRKRRPVAGTARRAPSWAPMPIGLSWPRKLKTFWLELTLHVRLGLLGLWRGLVHAQGVLAASRLYVTVYRADGRVERYGLVGTKVITDAGVAFLVDDWDNNGQDLTTLNFHGVGTNSTAEAAGDTALGAESTTALNPDNTRATGTRSQPAANQYRSVGTLTADAQILAREHGLFSQAATGGGTLWDRTVYALITLEAADSIQFTYTCTVSAGG